jgi:hypothetical protein
VKTCEYRGEKKKGKRKRRKKGKKERRRVTSEKINTTVMWGVMHLRCQ